VSARSPALLRVIGHGQMRFGGHGDLGFPACAQAVQAIRLPSTGGLGDERPPENCLLVIG